MGDGPRPGHEIQRTLQQLAQDGPVQGSRSLRRHHRRQRRPQEAALPAGGPRCLPPPRREARRRNRGEGLQGKPERRHRRTRNDCPSRRGTQGGRGAVLPGLRRAEQRPRALLYLPVQRLLSRAGDVRRRDRRAGKPHLWPARNLDDGL